MRNKARAGLPRQSQPHSGPLAKAARPAVVAAKRDYDDRLHRGIAQLG